MLVLPADHAIKHKLLFQDVLRDAEQELALGSLVPDPLVTLGVETKRAATEYGYLIPDLEQSQVRKLAAYVLEAFEEKPSVERATELWHKGAGVAWNAGMFMWKRGAIRRALERFMPETLDAIAEGFRAGSLDTVYSDLRSISIDYAVMERRLPPARS